MVKVRTRVGCKDSPDADVRFLRAARTVLHILSLISLSLPPLYPCPLSDIPFPFPPAGRTTPLLSPLPTFSSSFSLSLSLPLNPCPIPVLFQLSLAKRSRERCKFSQWFPGGRVPSTNALLTILTSNTPGDDRFRSVTSTLA